MARKGIAENEIQNYDIYTQIYHVFFKYKSTYIYHLPLYFTNFLVGRVAWLFRR